MPPRGWKIRIEDILDAIAAIEDFTRGMTLDSVRGDPKTVHAVTWNFAVIGEAARHVPAEIESRYPEVPWHRMRGLRNAVVHEYFGVSLNILWETIQDDLPPLVPQLRRILEENR